MKKKLFSKSTLILTFMLVGLILILNSCKKEYLDRPRMTGVDLLEAKAWVKENLKTTTNNPFYTMSPNWDELYVAFVDKQATIEIGLNNPNKIFIGDSPTDSSQPALGKSKSNIRLILFKDSITNKIVAGCYMAIINNGAPKNLQTLHYKQIENLNGKVYYFNLNGHFSNGAYFLGGEVLKSLGNHSTLINLTSKKLQSLGPPIKDKEISVKSDCVTGIEIPIFGESCVGVEGYMACTPYISGFEHIPTSCDGNIGESEGYANTRGSYVGGGGGGVSITSTQLSESALAKATLVDDGKPKIEDIKKYLNCFDDGKTAKSYTMTIYADQPIAGKNDAFKVVLYPITGSGYSAGLITGIGYTTADGSTLMDVGHTFVTFEKNNVDGTNVRQTLGFYPSSNPLSSKGAMEDNGLHVADVSYKINVTQDQFNKALEKVEFDFNNKQYILTNTIGDEYNCTDAALSWMNAAGANFGNSSSSSAFFKNTPGSFGQVLRNMPGASVGTQYGVLGKGQCN
jgi:hypothetical protein